MTADTANEGVTEPATEVDLLIKLLKLGSLINTPMKEGVCDKASVGATELKVVMALAGEGELAGHDLTEIMGMPAMNVSRAIASLKSRGWVEDTRDPGNRRRRPVRLTPEGEDAYAGMEADIAALARALLGSLGERQRRDFAKTADTIVAEMAGWIASRHGDFKMKR